MQKVRGHIPQRDTFITMIPWCSWLSRQPNMLKVSGSNPDDDTFALLFSPLSPLSLLSPPPSALFSPSSSRVSVALNVHPLTATQILNTTASDCSFYRRSRPSKARSRAGGKSAIVTTAQSFPRATRTRHRGFSGDRPRGRAVVVTSSNARRTEARESHTEDASSRSKRKNKRWCEQKIRAPTRNLTTTLIYSIKDCTGPMVWFV